MATNIEQQWASASLSNDLATTPTTSTAIPGEEDRGLANKLLALENAKQSKIQLLNNTTSAKLLDTSKYEDVTITGLQDADTFKLSDGRSVRVSDPLNRYDAAEIAHPEHEDGIWNRAKNLLGFGASKSEYAESTQKRAAARMLGKEPTAITGQDMIDIGNMQQVQALADLVRSDGEERWIAPLIRGVEQTDLTSGLDIKSKFKSGGSPDEHNRALGSFTNPSTGIDVTRQLALDPNQNAFAAENVNYGFERNKDGVRVDKLDTDGYLGNLVDAAQASSGRLAVSTVDTVVDAIVRGGKEIAQRTKGVTEEQANAELSKKFGDKVFNDKGDWIYLDKYKEGKEYGYDDTNLRLFGKEFKGVMSDPNSTIWEKAAVVLKAPIYAPEVLASSAADMAAAVHPVGMVAFGGNLMNEILADKQKIKGTSDLDSSDYGIALAASTIAAVANTATKGMAGIGGITSKVIKDGIKQMDQGAFTKLVKAVGVGTLEEATEEGVQELAQIVGTKLGTSKQDEIVSQETALDVGLSSALGGGAGGFTSGIRELTSVAGEYGSEKIQGTKESKPKASVSSPLDKYADGVADGKTDIDLKEFVNFVKANKDTVDHDKVQEIIQAYGANLEAAQSKVFRPDGTVDGDVIRANPPVVDELFKYIADIENDDDAVRMMDTLVAEFDDKVEMKEQLLSIRAQNREANNSLAEFMGVQKDIFESGFLNHESMTEALTSGNIQDKQSFLNYETAKVQKLQNTVEDVKDNLLKLVGEDAASIEALAYLEARNFGGNAQMTRSYETGVIANAARLVGVTTTGDAFADGKAARSAYKDSQLAKDVKKTSRVIKDFTDARVSGNDGKFEVKSHEVLGELANSITKSNNYRTDSGYSKVLDALTTETELINKFINLDRSSMKARVELLNMYNGLKSVSTENKQVVKDEVGAIEEKEEVTEDPTLKDFQLIDTKNPDLNKGFYEEYDKTIQYNSISGIVKKLSNGVEATDADLEVQSKFSELVEEELQKLAKVKEEPTKEDEVADVIKGSTPEHRNMYKVLEALLEDSGKKLGGGFVRNDKEKDGYKESDTNEDVEAGTFEKGINQDSINDLLPSINKNTVKSYINILNKVEDVKEDYSKISKGLRANYTRLINSEVHTLANKTPELVELLDLEITENSRVAGDSKLIPIVKAQKEKPKKNMNEDEVIGTIVEPKTEKVETYNEEYMAEANANAKPKIEKKGDSTKIKAIAGILEEGAEEETFKGTPAKARAAERELSLNINTTGEEYRSQKTWLDTSHAILRMMYEELNDIRSEFKPLIDEKYKEKKKLESELSAAYKLIGETKKAIKDGEAHLKTLEKNKETARRDSESIKFKSIRSVIAGFMDEIVAAIENLTNKLGLLGEKRKAENSRITEIKKQLAELTKEIKALEKKAEPLKKEEADKRKDIEKQHESIAETTNVVQGIKRDLQALNKERNRIRNAYKAGEKSRSSKRLANEGFKGFNGWNTPAKLTSNGTTISVGSPINKVLEVNNGIAPLGVVDYKDLIEPTKNETYRLVLEDVTKVILQTSGYSLKSHKNYITYNGDKKEYNSMAFNAPGLSLLISGERFEEQSLDKNAVLALDVAMNEWLSKDAINANEMTAKDVAKYYGMDEYEVTDEQLKEFKEFGIPLRFMAEGIGAKVVGHLGYKVTSSSDVAEKKEISTRLNESLGMYVIKLAEAKGLVRVEEKTYNEIAKIMGKDLDTETVVIDGTERLQGEVVTVPSIVFDEKAKRTGEKFFEIRKRDLGIVEQYKDVKFKRPSVANVKADIKRNKVTIAPTRLLEAKKDAMLREWHLKGIDGESVVAEMFEMKRDDVKTAMGYKSQEELEALPVTMQKAAESKNRQIATSVDSLFNLADNLKNGYEMNSLWFDYFIGKNNRLYLDSEGVNNQSDKFHRHLIFTEGQRATVIKGDKSERVFKLAVAQAFGLDVDKMPIEETMKKAEMLLGSQKEIEAGWDLVKKGAREFSIPGFKKPIKVKELGHLVDGIQAVRDYNEADGDFSTTLLVESDAVTSGFGLKLMQLIGNLEDGFGGQLTARDWLEKVGIFVGKDGKLLGGGIKDSYKTLAGDMTTENIASSVDTALEETRSRDKLLEDLGMEDVSNSRVKKRAKEVTDLVVGVIGKLTDDNGEVTGVARKLFKPPFMTFMYGAGFTKIKKELAALVTDLIMEKVAEYDQDAPNKELENLMMDVTGLDAKDAYKLFMEKDIKEHKIGDEKRTVYEKLEGNINASFGNTVEVTMKKEFGTIIETNNAVMSLTNAVFGVWNRKFKEKVEDLKGSKLTLDSVDEITDSLVNDFPIIKGPLSEGISDGIAIFKTEIANNLKEMFVNKYSNAGGYFNVEGKLTTKGVNHVIRIYKEASAAAGVIPIHTLDGATMVSTVLGQDVQQVFDAIVGGIDNIEGRVTDYNRNVFELSMNWNFLEEVLSLADRVLGNEDNDKYLKEHIAEQVSKDKEFNLGELAISLHEKSVANRKFKEAFKEQNGTIEHMVFNENTSYKFEKNSKVTPESILGKLSTATRNKVNEKIKESKLDGDSLKDLFDNCK